MCMSILSLRFNDEEIKVLTNASKVFGCGISSMVTQIVFEKLEDEYDLRVIKDYEQRKKNGTVELKSHKKFGKSLVYEFLHRELLVLQVTEKSRLLFLNQYRRYRIGDFRLLVEIDDDNLEIVAIEVVH